MDAAERIANRARRSISKYCYEECNAYCCRSCYLVMTEKEMKKVTQGRKDELIKEGTLKDTGKGKWSLNMGVNGCPSLKDNKCMIHTSKLRPKVCGDFPFFIEGKTIRLSRRCPAVKEGKLYPFVRQLVNSGYKVEKVDSFYDMELYKFKA